MNFKKYFFEFVSQEEFGVENHSRKREIVVLVGPPAIGKSTFIKNKYPQGSSIVVSRDDIVDEVSSSLGLQYDHMFEVPPKEAEIGKEVLGREALGKVIEAPAWMTWTEKVYQNVLRANNLINSKLEQRFKDSISSNKHIIVDMTNMNANARKNSLKYAIGKDLFKRAVVFTMSESDLPELLSRMKIRSDSIRSRGGSKTIGEDVVDRMIKSFQKITPEEDFDKVDTVYTFAPQKLS